MADPPAELDLGDQLARVLEELRRSRAEQKRLELMLKGLSATLREQADLHIQTLGRLQQREEEALRRSEERLQLLLNSAGEGIYGLDAEGKTTFLNPAASRLIGWSEEELIGKGEHELLHHTRSEGSPYPRDLCLIQASIRDGLVHHVDRDVFWKKDGGSFPVEYTSTPVREGDDIVGAVVVFRDITERRLAEEQRSLLMEELQDSVRARDDFLSIAAHELRTPLTPLRLQVTSLRRSLAKPEALDAGRFAGKLATLETQIDRLERLIEQMLDVSRITVGRLEIQREEVDLAAVVREVAGRLDAQLKRSGSTLSIAADGPVVGHWDPLRIEQVVTNFMTNAIKYGSGKPIEVSTRCEEGEGVLSVRDQGIGIAAEDQARLFQRFERLVSIRHYGGFGLGLWIVDQIVKAHGGRISVQSAVGKGSTFTMRLPLAGP